jgi:hypothetical protein
VRGAEVVEVRDEEGGLMNDFTGRVRLEDRKPPKGESTQNVHPANPSTIQSCDSRKLGTCACVRTAKTLYLHHINWKKFT